MRILLVDPSLYTPPYDGALAAALAARGHEVVLAARAPRSSDPPLGEAFERAVGRVTLEPIFYRHGERWRGRGSGSVGRIAKGLEHLRGLAALRALTERFRPDVVHWQWPSLPLLDATCVRRLGRRAPQIVTVHDRRVFKAKRGLRRLQSLGWNRFLGAADALIVHVPSTREALAGAARRWPPIAIVPHPVFDRARDVGGLEGSQGDACPPERLRVTFFGRLSDDKGIDVLAEALAQLPADLRRRLQVRIHGRPIAEDRRAARALAQLRALDDVELVADYVPEAALDALLASTDVVVLPHREVDGSGMMMKALGFDVGLVAADVDAFREVAGDAPAVRYFRREQPRSLAVVLAELAIHPDLVAAMRVGARALRIGALSWAHAASATEQVYERARALRRLSVAPARGAAVESERA